MTVNLKKKKEKDELRVIWNSSCCSKETPSKNVRLWQYVAMKLSFIFKFQLVPFASTLILGDPFDLILCEYSSLKNR